MVRRGDLTQGDITGTLTRLALPIMGTSLINMLYTLTDIMWLGRLSTQAVAAAGAIGTFTWFASSLMMIARVGAGIGVSQSYGKEDWNSMGKYIGNSIKLNIIIALSYAGFLFIFRHKLVGFFQIQEVEVVDMAINYLEIICIGLLFSFMNPLISTIFNSVGNSLTPFYINVIGLVVNMILDPLLIFGYGPFPKLGIRGAATATSLAQLIVTLIFLLAIGQNKELFYNVRLFKKPDMDYIKEISKLGTPSFLQSGLQASIAMFLTRILSKWGATVIAVQSTGTQIESVSWMTAEGFASALTAFTGQNYGAKNYDRVERGYKKGLRIVTIFGIAVSLAFIFKGDSIFALFTPDDPLAIKEGANYLRILGYAQAFMCMEIASMGTFNGLGRPLPPAIVGAVGNSLRIPLALILSATALGVDGVWWTISLTCIMKGIVGTTFCVVTLKKMREEVEEGSI